MPRPALSREAIALLRTWVDELEAALVEAEKQALNSESAATQEDRAIAAAWATRHRARQRRQPPARNRPRPARKRRAS